MTIENTYLDKLKQLVKETSMLRMETSTDFERLHEQMQERVREAIGITTLKRLWGYVDGYATVRESTLNVLCRFVGYPDWHTFVADYCEVESAQTSQRLFSATVTVSQLSMGDILEVAWNPNRRLLLRHDGDGFFTVIKACNSKVKCGDTFHCDRFMLGQPLYIDSLKHGDSEPTLFVLGKQGGLTRCLRTIKR